MPIGRIPAPSGSRRPSRAAIFIRHRVRHRPMRSCSENKTTTGNVGVGIGIGIEAHILTIPIPIRIPTPDIFKRRRVGRGHPRLSCGKRVVVKEVAPAR